MGCDQLMRLLVVALMMEARPFISALSLKGESGHPFPVFRNGTTLLIVSGTGSVAAAAAVGYVCGAFRGQLHTAINLGMGGANPDFGPLHQWYRIHQVIDAGNERYFHPDIPDRHGFPEASLRTVPFVVKEPLHWEGLFDMEGAGFLAAAQKWFPADRIALLKWVSDPLSGQIDIEATRSALERGLDPVLTFLENWAIFHRSSEENALPEVQLLLDRLEETLPLTVSQRLQLQTWLQGYLARGCAASEITACFPEATVRHKHEVRKVMERIRDACSS
jgi:hypothetical protein